MMEEDQEAPLRKGERLLQRGDQRVNSSNVGFAYLRLIGDDLSKLVCLRSAQIYAIGRDPRRCRIVLDSPAISRRHCEVLLDRSDCKLKLIDGSFGSKHRVFRVSSNGVFVNGRRLPCGVVAELNTGDLILLCAKRNHGFLVEKIVFTEINVRNVRFDDVSPRAESLVGKLRGILGRRDLISYLRTLQNDDCIKTGVNSENYVIKDGTDSEKSSNLGCYSDGKKFSLNRLKSIDKKNAPDSSTGVTLQQLFHPIDTLIKVFIATFTCDVPWFLDYCKIPCQLPITIACHNSERCWSASHESRWEMPLSSYPNLLLVYPRFPDEIAFGKDRKKHGVACHHPKLILLHREDALRVVITSANLVSRQWNHITNTVWWQDFPRRKKYANYLSLFGSTEEHKSDFVAHLAGFLASLINDVPNQAQWVDILANYDFNEAACYIVASVPGIHISVPSYVQSDYSLSAKQVMHTKSILGNYLGCVHTSVVGINHRFGASVDPNGGQFKLLSRIIGRCIINSYGTVEVILKRNANISADVNAVSVIVKDREGDYEGDSVVVGFLLREIAKWVSPLSDSALLSFSAFIFPKETLEAAYAGNPRIQIFLYLSKGSEFDKISDMIHGDIILASLCSLLALLKRNYGLWRLQEVLSQHKWPESSETDFIYGSSSVGTSVSPDFLASFSTAAGKKSCKYSDSQESDPEWGRWGVEHELRNPSMKFLFPTIDRVKSGVCGVHLYKYLLCLSEKTWQRLRPAGVFHDAIPYPPDRIGYPMHVKVARRRFHSKAYNHSFGWIYCGSHNFSPSAWGQTLNPSSSPSVSKLHICNYELGIIFLYPEHHNSIGTTTMINIDDIALPFEMPAPKYKCDDRPATAQAMREVFDAQVEINEIISEEADEDEDEHIIEISEEGDEHEGRIYAEMLWDQVFSSQG